MQAPNFALPDQSGDIKTLADYARKWLVLYFYPKVRTTQQAVLPRPAVFVTSAKQLRTLAMPKWLASAKTA